MRVLAIQLLLVAGVIFLDWRCHETFTGVGMLGIALIGGWAMVRAERRGRA